MTSPGYHDGDRPVLTNADLREELTRIFGRDDGGSDGRPRLRRAAFAGMPASGVEAVEIEIGDDRVRFRVVHARCELATRRALVDAGKDPLVVLVDFEGRLPLDITGRLGGRVRLVSDEQRLMRKFGVRSVSPDVLGGVLGRILLAEPIEVGGFQGAALDLEGAWRVVLGRALDVPREIVLTEERVVAQAARAADGGELRAMVGRHPGLGAALDTYLRERVGPVAALAVRVLQLGRGRDVAALAFVLDALSPLSGLGGYAAAWLKITLSKLDPELANSTAGQRPLLDRWAGLASGLWLQLNGDLDSVRALADRWLADDSDLSAAIAPRPFLATSLARAKQDIADALDHVLAEGVARASQLGALVGAFRRLEQHRLRDRVEHAAQCERARMAVRLAGWLADQVAGPAPFVSAADAVATLAGQHADDGGFVDLARARARGVKIDALDAAIARVVERADAVRDRRDELFAEALARWDRGRARVLPIEDVLDRIAVPFLAGQGRRKLLVLLLDGLAWDDAVELVEDLEPLGVGPLRWQPERPAGKLLPPVVAAMPTITGVSRAALFAGKVPKPGDSLNSGADPERFANHKGLLDLVGQTPRLLLKGQAEERPGHLSDAAHRLVSSDARVVGLVVNAIDDQLKAGAGAHVPTTVEMIKALPDILSASAQAGRAILMVADHGHVSGARFGAARPRVGEGGARYRELGSDEAPADGEIVIEGERGWRSKRTRRLALLVRETDTFVAAPHAGEHGGASLAEAIAPALLIASDGLSEACDDPDLELRRFPRPRWWSLDADVYTPAPAASGADGPLASPPPGKRPKGVRPGQIAFEMPGLSPQLTPAPGASGTGAAERIAARIRSSPLYTEASAADRADWDNHVIPAVQAVVDAGGTMSRTRFADVRRILIGRLPSVLVKVRDRLNLGQHAVFVDDVDQGLLRFDQALFDDLFRI